MCSFTSKLKKYINLFYQTMVDEFHRYALNYTVKSAVPCEHFLAHNISLVIVQDCSELSLFGSL